MIKRSLLARDSKLEGIGREKHRETRLLISYLITDYWMYITSPKVAIAKEKKSST